MSNARIWANVGLLLVGILGLGMSVCGGALTVVALIAARGSTPGERYFAIVLIGSVPSLLLGGATLVGVWTRSKALRRAGRE